MPVSGSYRLYRLVKSKASGRGIHGREEGAGVVDKGAPSKGMSTCSAK